MHLWQIFFFGLHAYFWKNQVILWCRNPFLEFFYLIWSKIPKKYENSNLNWARKMNCETHLFKASSLLGHCVFFFNTMPQCSRMHLWQNFFFGLHAYFWKIQVILWCRNPFLEFFYYIDYGFLASYFWHFFLPFCNFYYWKVTNLALIEKKELCRQVWDLF